MPDQVRRLGVMTTRGRPEMVGEARRRVEEAAAAAGIEVGSVEEGELDVLVVLGGDGTMLRALRATLGTRTPVFGINFGRVGFLTTVGSEQLDSALERAFAGDYRVVELCTLEARLDGGTQPVVNDVVVTSSHPGRMVDLGWEIGGERLADQPCDGMICCTPTGSTAYNLSNGGPVIMRGLDAMAITHVAPHSLHARPLVVPPGLGLTVWNRTADVSVAILVDGQRVGDLDPQEALAIEVGGLKALLALLPEVTFFSRYREVFLEAGDA